MYLSSDDVDVFNSLSEKEKQYKRNGEFILFVLYIVVTFTIYLLY